MPPVAPLAPAPAPAPPCVHVRVACACWEALRAPETRRHAHTAPRCTAWWPPPPDQQAPPSSQQPSLRSAAFLFRLSAWGDHHQAGQRLQPWTSHQAGLLAVHWSCMRACEPHGMHLCALHAMSVAPLHSQHTHDESIRTPTAQDGRLVVTLSCHFPTVTSGSSRPAALRCAARLARAPLLLPPRLFVHATGRRRWTQVPAPWHPLHPPPLRPPPTRRSFGRTSPAPGTHRQGRSSRKCSDRAPACSCKPSQASATAGEGLKKLTTMSAGHTLLCAGCWPSGIEGEAECVCAASVCVRNNALVAALIEVSARVRALKRR